MRPLPSQLLTVASACLLSACSTATSTPSTPAQPTATKSTMSPSALSAHKPFETILGAMKSEALLAPRAFEPTTLTSLFGEHRLNSATDDFKPKVQTHDLSFPDGLVLNMSAGPSFRTGKPSVSFSSGRAKGKENAPLNLTVDDLVRMLGQPDSQVDIRAQQIEGATRLVDDQEEAATSPPALLLRGQTTHQLGNTHLKWRIKTAHTSVLIGAEINGDGSVSRVFGDQVEE